MNNRSLKICGALVILFLHFSICGFSQVKVYPPHWWSGMENDTLELMLYNPSGFKEVPSVEKRIKVISAELGSNPNYAFLKISLENVAAGKLIIGKGKSELTYVLKERKGYKPKGLNPQDALYLITPDRFANGNSKNDEFKSMKETEYGREHDFGRHGGDIAGISNHLDYIQNLGFNSLWISPLLTNDMPKESYHGYAITDHYEIDPRFGTANEYHLLVEKMHQREMKMIMDVVYNHVGTEHQFFKDLPDSSFFNFHDGYENGYRQTNYRAATLFDPHVSKSDSVEFAKGWFVKTMPDINQENQHMAAFLIQNSIWWIEEFEIDGFRIDTYTYPDQRFMSRLSKRIKDEYADFFIFGETWVHGPEIQSYFPQGNLNNPINSNMDAVTDFTLYYAIQDALNKKPGWNEGIAKVYYRLTADYLYEKPELLVTFLDNHDLARIYGHFGEDKEKLKTALGMLFTLRGIPCVYYGTEILMKETANHGLIRQAFPGGWANDTVNKFTAEGRTFHENEMHDFVSKLLNYRKTSEALTSGKLTQFVPVDGVYVYFRHCETETLMVLVNANQNDSKEVSLDRYKELWPKGSTGTNVMSGEGFSGNSLKLEAKSIVIIQLD